MFRIFKKPDGSILQSHYTCAAEVAKFPDYTAGLPYIDVCDEEYEPSDSETGRYHEMYYFDGDCSVKGLKVDRAWEARIMPDFLVLTKHRERCLRLFEAELDKETPDPVALARHQRSLHKCAAEKDPAVITQWALDGLDARVAKGEPDKPKIREQLLEKLQQLKNVSRETLEGSDGTKSEVGVGTTVQSTDEKTRG